MPKCSIQRGTSVKCSSAKTNASGKFADEEAFVFAYFSHMSVSYVTKFGIIFSDIDGGV